MKLVQHSPKQVIDRLEKLVKEKGMTVFARVDGSPGGHDARDCAAAANLKKALSGLAETAAAK